MGKMKEKKKKKKKKKIAAIENKLDGVGGIDPVGGNSLCGIMLARLAWAGPGLCLRGARLASHHGKEPTKSNGRAAIELKHNRGRECRFLRPWSRRHGHSQILAAVAWDEKKPASQVGSCRIYIGRVCIYVCIYI